MNQKKKEFSVFMIISLAFLVIYTISLFAPLFWALMSSFKGKLEYIIDSLSFPKKFVNNYKEVLKYFFVPLSNDDGTTTKLGIAIMIVNSSWYALGTAFISTTVSFMVAYVVARFHFKFCDVIYTVIVLQMIIPMVGTLPSELRIAIGLGLYDTPYGILFMKSYVTGLYFLSFYGALRVIPKDYEEAAYLDGANNFTVMSRIIIPMVKGVFFTIYLLMFISLWNDYGTIMIYLPSYPTLAYGLWYFVNVVPEAGTTPMKLAGCMLLAIPLFLLFALSQKRLLGNITVGGLK